MGEDTFGLKLQQSMAAEGIGVEGLTTIAGMHSGTVIVVDAAGRNQIAVASGANLSLTVDWVARFREDFAWAQVVVCQLEVPLDTVLWTLRTARQHGVTTVLNPAPAQPVPSEIWPLVDYLTPNEVEAAQVSGLPLAALHDAGNVARALLARGPGVVILTLGAQGALVGTRDHMVHVPALPVSVVGATAGDAFNGASRWRWLRGVRSQGPCALPTPQQGWRAQRGAQNSLRCGRRLRLRLADGARVRCVREVIGCPGVFGGGPVTQSSKVCVASLCRRSLILSQGLTIVSGIRSWTAFRASVHRWRQNRPRCVDFQHGDRSVRLVAAAAWQEDPGHLETACISSANISRASVSPYVTARSRRTPFQQRVWRELQRIPFGTTLTYRDSPSVWGCHRQLARWGMPMAAIRSLS